MPRRPGPFRTTSQHGLQIIYQVYLRSQPNGRYPWALTTNVLSRNEANVTPAPLPTSSILASLGQAAFVWDIATDAISWSEPIAAVFPDIAPASLSTGAEFAKLIEPQRSIRSDALNFSPPAHGADGVPYRIEYAVRSTSSMAPVWIEETGCWFAGPDGRPARCRETPQLWARSR